MSKRQTEKRKSSTTRVEDTNFKSPDGDSNDVAQRSDVTTGMSDIRVNDGPVYAVAYSTFMVILVLGVQAYVHRNDRRWLKRFERDVMGTTVTDLTGNWLKYLTLVILKQVKRMSSRTSLNGIYAPILQELTAISVNIGVNLSVAARSLLSTLVLLEAAIIGETGYDIIQSKFGSASTPITDGDGEIRSPREANAIINTRLTDLYLMNSRLVKGIGIPSDFSLVKGLEVPTHLKALPEAAYVLLSFYTQQVSNNVDAVTEASSIYESLYESLMMSSANELLNNPTAADEQVVNKSTSTVSPDDAMLMVRLYGRLE